MDNRLAPWSFGLALLLGCASSPPGPDLTPLEIGWRGRQAFRSTEAIILAHSEKVAREVGQQLIDRIEELRSAADEVERSALDEYFTRPGLVVAMDVGDELFAATPLEHLQMFPGPDPSTDLTEGGGLEISVEDPYATEGVMPAIARATPAGLPREDNGLEFPPELLRNAAWIAVLPTDRTYSNLMDQQMAVGLSRLNLAQRLTAKLALPLMRSRIERQLRVAFRPAVLGAILSGDGLPPDLVRRLVKRSSEAAMRQEREGMVREFAGSESGASR